MRAGLNRRVPSRKCDTYSAIVRPACDSLGWTYYQAAQQFGSPKVSAAEPARAKRIGRGAEESPVTGRDAHTAGPWPVTVQIMPLT